MSICLNKTWLRYYMPNFLLQRQIIEELELKKTNYPAV